MDDELLFERMREVDRGAMKVFFERYMERLFAYAVGFTRNREDAEDVVQEAFIH